MRSHRIEHHVVEYLRGYLHANWRVLRHVQFRDPAFSFLLTIEKALASGGPETGGRRACGRNDGRRDGA